MRSRLEWLAAIRTPLFLPLLTAISPPKVFPSRRGAPPPPARRARCCAARGVGGFARWGGGLGKGGGGGGVPRPPPRGGRGGRGRPRGPRRQQGRCDRGGGGLRHGERPPPACPAGVETHYTHVPRDRGPEVRRGRPVVQRLRPGHDPAQPLQRRAAVGAVGQVRLERRALPVGEIAVQVLR